MNHRERQAEVSTSTARVVQRPDQVQQAGTSVVSQASSVQAPPVLGSPAGVLMIQQLKGNRAVGQRLVQQSAEAQGLREPSDSEIHSAAAEGIRTPATTLPFLDRIQASFGRHSIGHVKAHVGPEAAQASRAMNALAFASGDHVVFGSTPDLRTAAHEAAHVVQQQAGVQLDGGIGHAGDSYEHNADAVADAVVAGRSAESLLVSIATNFAVGGAGTSPIDALEAITIVEPRSLQLLQNKEFAPAPEDAFLRCNAPSRAIAHAHRLASYVNIRRSAVQKIEIQGLNTKRWEDVLSLYEVYLRMPIVLLANLRDDIKHEESQLNKDEKVLAERHREKISSILGSVTDESDVIKDEGSKGGTVAAAATIQLDNIVIERSPTRFGGRPEEGFANRYAMKVDGPDKWLKAEYTLSQKDAEAQVLTDIINFLEGKRKSVRRGKSVIINIHVSKGPCYGCQDRIRAFIRDVEDLLEGDRRPQLIVQVIYGEKEPGLRGKADIGQGQVETYYGWPEDVGYGKPPIFVHGVVG